MLSSSSPSLLHIGCRRGTGIRALPSSPLPRTVQPDLIFSTHSHLRMQASCLEAPSAAAHSRFSAFPITVHSPTCRISNWCQHRCRRLRETCLSRGCRNLLCLAYDEASCSRGGPIPNDLPERGFAGLQAHTEASHILRHAVVSLIKPGNALEPHADPAQHLVVSPNT